MKLLLLVLTSFIFPLNFASRGTDFYLNKVNEAYERYTINVNEDYEEYKLSIVSGIVNGEAGYGVYFEPGNSNLMLVCKMGDEIYEYQKSSDGSVWVVAVKYTEEATVLLYNSSSKESIVKMQLDEAIFSKNFSITGEAKGSEYSEVKSMNDRFNTQIILYITCGVIITVCIVLLLVFRATHSGLFSKARRTNTTFNMKEFLQNTPEEADPYDPIKEVEIIEYVESSTEATKPLQIDESPKKSAKEYLMDKGFIVEYNVLSEEEKDKVMLELMLLKNEGKITNEEYKKETIELWGK